MERFGLVGLPNAGKSSLFNAVTGGVATVAAHPYSTTETNVGVGAVPDDRLERLAVMSKSKKVVHATAEFVDIAGLQKGSSRGEGLGNRFLAGIREVDAICFVLRAFADENVPGGADPLDDLATLELELVFADAASLEGQLERRRKAARADKSLAAEVDALEQALATLHDATPLYRRGLDADARELLRPYFLLTAKPVLVVVNFGEDDLDRADDVVRPVAEELGGAAEVLGICVQLEAEAARLDACRAHRAARRPRARRGCAPPAGPVRVPPPRPPHLPDDRRQGEPGLDLPGRRQGTRVRRASSTATCSGGSSAPR